MLVFMVFLAIDFFLRVWHHKIELLYAYSTQKTVSHTNLYRCSLSNHTEDFFKQRFYASGFWDEQCSEYRVMNSTVARRTSSSSSGSAQSRLSRQTAIQNSQPAYSVHSDQMQNYVSVFRGDAHKLDAELFIAQRNTSRVRMRAPNGHVGRWFVF